MISFEMECVFVLADEWYSRVHNDAVDTAATSCVRTFQFLKSTQASIDILLTSLDCLMSYAPFSVIHRLKKKKSASQLYGTLKWLQTPLSCSLLLFAAVDGR